MFHDSVYIRYYDIVRTTWVTEKWSIKGIEYAEQLAFEILQKQKVGPVYRMLFGLKLIDRNLWLAPNYKLEDLFESSSEHDITQKGDIDNDIPNLELRMRFRPTFLTRLKGLDRNAFEMIFSQIRYDFIKTKFSSDKRDFVILNESVQCLIVIDLLRHSLENGISIDTLLNRVKLKDFIPHVASSWQRTSIGFFGDMLNLKNSLEIGWRNCTDVTILKKTYMEQFLQHVCKDYGSETYEAKCLSMNNQPIRIRLTYDETESPYCKIEFKINLGSTGKSGGKWTDVCDIYTVSYGTLNDKSVELNRSKGNPFRIEFPTSSHAKSFLSLIDGYYRLMRKWHFNFCPNVTSPDLRYLIENRIHGPIGLEAMRLKLSRQKKAGTYLIRRCMEQDNRYLIDVLLQSKAILTICVDWDPVERQFTKKTHEVSARGQDVDVILKEEKIERLKTLIQDLQIREKGLKTTCPYLQLKYLLKPSEYDDCPALLLSIPREKLEEMETAHDAAWKSQLSKLPRMIPPSLLKFKSKSYKKSGNRMVARAAELNGERPVIVKHHEDDYNLSTHELYPNGYFNGSGVKNFILDPCYSDHHSGKFFNNLRAEQIRLADWVFIRHHLFAETLGIDFSTNALVQEFFKLGSLDTYLAHPSRATSTSEDITRAIPCQLASALLFLQEKQIIHGKLRCHNIFLTNLNPINIKITDPLGSYDFAKDCAFLPPELCFNAGDLPSGQLQIHTTTDYDSGIDVWAFGTTLWQIYSHGRRPPPGVFANTLIRPIICPDQVWRLIENCWLVDLNSRVSPQVIYRDLNDYFAWGREAHTYQYIPDSINRSPQTPSSVIMCKPSENTPTPVAADSIKSSSNLGSLSDLIVEKENGIGSPDKEAIPAKKTFQFINWKKIRLFGAGSGATTVTNKDLVIDYATLKNDSTCSISVDASGSLTSTIDDYLDHSTAQVENKNSASPTNSDSWLIDPSKLKLGCEIGRGSCGVVKKAELYDWQNVREQVVAVKFIHDVSSDEYTKRIEDLGREFSILKDLKHENIIKTFGIVDDTNVMIVVEHLPLGSLLFCLRNSHDYSTTLPLKRYARGVARGMEYLESKGVIHRDLAARNILLKSPYEVKICDFGLAHYLGGENQYRVKSNERALPLRWCAPETLKDWIYNHKTDVWSYGIVLWEIYSGGSNPQYSGTLINIRETLVVKKERLRKPVHCPQDIYDLMHRCWTEDPESRWSFAQICSYLDNDGSQPSDIGTRQLDSPQ